MLAWIKNIFAKHPDEQHLAVPYEERRSAALKEMIDVEYRSKNLSDLERQCCEEVIKLERVGGLIVFSWPEGVLTALDSLVEYDKSLKFTSDEEKIRLAEARSRSTHLRFMDSRPDAWLFEFSPTFTKQVESADKTLQARILAAITRIAIKPMSPVGNSIKPLTGDLKGLWRYRIGDHRLIYAPNIEFHRITIISIDKREDAYA